MFLIFDYQQTAGIDCQVGAPTERQLKKATNSDTSHINRYIFAANVCCCANRHCMWQTVVY